MWLPSKPWWKVWLMRRASLFMCHMFYRITQTLLPSVHTFLLISISYRFLDFFLQFYLASASSSAVFSHISFMPSWPALPTCALLFIFLFFPARWTEQREKETQRVGEKEQSVQFSLGGLCPSCLLMVCQNSSSQCKR